MLRSSLFLGSFAFLSTLGLACSSNSVERLPPGFSGCGTSCGSTGSSAGSGSGQGGAGGEAAVGGVEGTVYEFVDALFTDKVASTAEATVYGFSAATQQTVDAAVKDGSYSLLEAESSLQAFLAVYPADAASYVTTLYTADTTDGKEDLTLVRRGYLEDLYAIQGINPATDKGSVLVHVVDSNGNPVTGVTITSADAEAVLYRLLGSYVSGGTATDSTGTAILLNATAATFPGGFASITFSTKASPVTVRVAKDSVTIVTVRL